MDLRDANQTVLATSRMVHLRPMEATAAMQACVASFSEASSGPPDVLRLNLPAGACADLRAASLQGASARNRSLLVGTIRSRRGWVSVPIEIETAPVSAGCSELVVRPVGPTCLRSTSHRQLFDRSSHALADFFCMEIGLAGLATTTPRATPRTLRPVSEPVSLAV